jgi:hypothetical protein
MFKPWRLLGLLRVLREQLYQTAMSQEEGVVIASNITKSLGDICKALVPHCDVQIKTGVAVHKSRETVSFMGNTEYGQHTPKRS